VDAQSGLLLARHGPAALAPPGSTLKPFVLAALIESGKLRADEKWPCPGNLRIAGRSLACSHPPLGTPVDVRAALAYSCNCFVAHFAERFAAGELPRALARYGIEVRPANTRLQALGEDGVAVTAEMLAMAYRRLASAVKGDVLAGLEDAVEYGTAQRANVAKWKVAGKTGSVLSPEGARVAWFAGFAPSRAPKVVVAVMVQGRSGGGDAAPVAGRILESL
jgi:penicillin-binding protein 2